MNCIYCKGTGKYKKPNDQEQFDKLVDIEMEKGYFVSIDIAEKKAFDKVGYTIIDCPYCKRKENS